MRSGDVSPAVEGADSGCRKSTQAESRTNNKKITTHTNCKNNQTTTTGPAEATDKGKRLRMRQQRSSQFRNQQAYKQRKDDSGHTHVSRMMNAENRVEENKVYFLTVAGEKLAKVAPSPKDPEHTVNRKSLHATRREHTAKRIKENTSEIHQFQMSSKRVKNAENNSWTDGGHSWVTDTKPSGCTRVTLENVNSTKYWTEGDQSSFLQINHTREHLQTDLLSIVEARVDWNGVELGRGRFLDILGRGEHKTRITGWNTTEKLAHAQPGGMAMMACG